MPSMSAIIALARRPLPYQSTRDLPEAVRLSLPPHAQEIFRAAFNNAWVEYANRGPKGREAAAFRVAWAAVRKRYRKLDGRWVARP
jgi:cation transport regulator